MRVVYRQTRAYVGWGVSWRVRCILFSTFPKIEVYSSFGLFLPHSPYTPLAFFRVQMGRGRLPLRRRAPWEGSKPVNDETMCVNDDDVCEWWHILIMCINDDDVWEWWHASVWCVWKMNDVYEWWKMCVQDDTHVNVVCERWMMCVMILKWLNGVRAWCVWHDSFYMCDMTNSHVKHDSFTCAAWRIHTCSMTQWRVWHDSMMCVAWLNVVSDMTQWCVWMMCRNDWTMCVYDEMMCVNHDSVCEWWHCVWNIYAAWLNDVCNMTQWCAWHDSTMCVTWLKDVCEMT